MFSIEIEHQVWQEQHKDRLRVIERQQLAQQVKMQQPARLTLSRKAATWLGEQLVRLGSKLQSLDPTSLPAAPARKTN